MQQLSEYDLKKQCFSVVDQLRRLRATKSEKDERVDRCYNWKKSKCNVITGQKSKCHLIKLQKSKCNVISVQIENVTLSLPDIT